MLRCGAWHVTHFVSRDRIVCVVGDVVSLCLVLETSSERLSTDVCCDPCVPWRGGRTGVRREVGAPPRLFNKHRSPRARARARVEIRKTKSYEFCSPLSLSEAVTHQESSNFFLRACPIEGHLYFLIHCTAVVRLSVPFACVRPVSRVSPSSPRCRFTGRRVRSMKPQRANCLRLIYLTGTAHQ